MREPRQIDIREMAKWLEIRKNNEYPTTLLLGSRAGELFRSAHFYENMQSFDHPGFNQQPTIKKFSQCYRILKTSPISEFDIHSILNTSLKETKITPADACLAALIKLGYFEEIITTNIDDVLEQALIQAGIRENHELEVLIPKRDRFLPEQKNFQYRLTKAYGDFLSREYYVITGHSLLSKEKFEELDKFLRHVLAKDILVIGIDPDWDQYILRIFPTAHGTTIWFVNEENLIEDPRFVHIFDGRKAQFIPEHAGGYDRFIRMLHNHLYGNFVPIHAELAKDIISRLEDLVSNQQTILEEIKKLQHELDKLSQRRRRR